MRNGNVTITGVEFTKMGQKGVMGRYPIHFHNQSIFFQYVNS